VSDILVVDDNPLNTELYRRHLEGAGHRVTTAESGDAALRILDTPWPDLIILDVHMPGMDGFELCRNIRSREMLAEIPILFITAKYRDDVSMARGLALGASDYLAKPFNSSELLARVAAVARQHTEEVALRERTADLEQVVVERDHALAESERRFRGVVEHAAEAICLIDRRSRFTEINPMACSLLGKERSALIHMRVADFLDPAEHRRLRREVAAALRRHTNLQLTCTVTGANGEHIPLEISASRLQGQLLVLAKDVREKRLLEEQLRRSDRLHAIAQLATGLVHEIRNPLTGIAAALHHWQRQGHDPPERQEMTGRMLHEIDRLEHLLRDLLNFANPRPQRRQSVRVVELFTQVRSLIEPQIIDRNVSFSFQVDPEELTFDVDSHQIEQVLLNLCLNALHAVANEGEVDLRAFRSGDHVVVEVKDTGSGIAMADLEHIFDPFFSTKGSTGSSGLGLSVVQRIIQDHGGEILVNSDPPHGTTFTLLIPSSLQPR